MSDTAKEKSTVKVKKFFWRNARVGVRVRLAFLWAITLTGAILFAGLAPLASLGATVLLCAAIVLVSILFVVWTKKGYEYFSITWGRMVPFPTKARYYTVPAVVIGLLVGLPILWISADAKWGEGFYEVMRGLGYVLGALVAMAIVTGLIWAGITARRAKIARAKMDSWNEIQQIKNGYEAQLAQAAKREAALNETILQERNAVQKAFSGEFIRLLAELTLERQNKKNPDKFRAQIRKLLENSLEVVYGRKATDKAIANAMMVLIRESEREKNPPAPETPNQPVDGNVN